MLKTIRPSTLKVLTLAIGLPFSMSGFSTLASAETFTIDVTSGNKLTATEIAKFDEPWAMTFLPGKGDAPATMLVTTKSGKIYHVEQNGKRHKIKGVPKVAYGGQGGLGDIVAHPDYASNGYIYFSYADGKGGDRGAVVTRARLKLKKDGSGKLTALESIWKQKPKVSGRGHYGHRIAFGPEGSPFEGQMFITSGDRQKLRPAQDMGSSLGKIIRLNDDGSIPVDNPWQQEGKKARTFWSMGHRNPLGIAFDASGNLWSTEMGPRNGDELNFVQKGENYGWPLVSEGNHYSGARIPNHDTRPEFIPPKQAWVPSIAPSSLMIYSGDAFPDWKGDAFIGGLAGRALVRVNLKGNTAQEAERFEWSERIREVEQGPNGAIWVLEDGDGGRLLKLE